ncbi:MAG: hypothetical protein DRO40_05715 [Thermoprotei archaeon]|nr:MAG: hypothetical protein DRO40_05715 [Thermoprotei archaeon]
MLNVPMDIVFCRKELEWVGLLDGLWKYMVNGLSSSQTMYELQIIKDVAARETLEEGVEVKNIILFGSRARGDYREELLGFTSYRRRFS